MPTDGRLLIEHTPVHRRIYDAKGSEHYNSAAQTMTVCISLTRIPNCAFRAQPLALLAAAAQACHLLSGYGYVDEC